MLKFSLGKTEAGVSSDIRLKVDIPIVNFEDCRRVYGEKNIVIIESQVSSDQNIFLNFNDTKTSSTKLCAGGVKGKDSW